MPASLADALNATGDRDVAARVECDDAALGALTLLVARAVAFDIGTTVAVAGISIAVGIGVAVGIALAFTIAGAVGIRVRVAVGVVTLDGHTQELVYRPTPR